MLPTYSPNLFVDRETEIESIMSKARQLAQGLALSRQADRVIHVPGFAGFGKTWLLYHLHYLLTENPKTKLPNLIVLPLWLDAWARKPSCLPPYESITCELLLGLLKQITQARSIASLLPTAQGVTPQEASLWVQDMINEADGRHPSVLLVDALDEAPPEWLRILEERLFASLALRQPYVLIVMAGRNLYHNWMTPALKPLPDDQAARLKPLSQDDTRRQLALQFPGTEALADSIYKVTKGAPSVNSFIASQVGPSRQMPDVLPTLAEYNQRVMRDVPEDLRWCFYALCVSPGFQVEWMEHLLPIADPKGGTWDSDACQKLLPRLRDTRLVRAYRKDGEYRFWLDEYLSPLLALELQKRDLDLWWRLHCALMRMYQAWAKDPDFASTAPRWQQEAERVASFLRDAGYDPEQCK